MLLGALAGGVAGLVADGWIEQDSHGADQ